MSLIDKWFEKRAQKLGYAKQEDIENLKAKVEETSFSLTNYIKDELENVLPDAKDKVSQEYEELFNYVEADARNHVRLTIEKTLSDIKKETIKLDKRRLTPLEEKLEKTIVALSVVDRKATDILKDLTSDIQQNVKNISALGQLYEANKKSISEMNRKFEKPFYINNKSFRLEEKNNIYASDIQMNVVNGHTVSYILEIIDKRTEYIFQSIDEILGRIDLTEEEVKKLEKIKEELAELQSFKKDISGTVDRLAHPKIKRRFSQRSLEEIQEEIRQASQEESK